MCVCTTVFYLFPPARPKHSMKQANAVCVCVKSIVLYSKFTRYYTIVNSIFNNTRSFCFTTCNKLIRQQEIFIHFPSRLLSVHISIFNSSLVYHTRHTQTPIILLFISNFIAFAQNVYIPIQIK